MGKELHCDRVCVLPIDIGYTNKEDVQAFSVIHKDFEQLVTL